MTEPSAGDGGPAGERTPVSDPAVCFRHPDREAHIRCVRCERRICPECMIPAAVGFQCPDCVRMGNRSVRTATTVFGGRVSRDPGWVSKVLIGLNVVVFVLQNTVAGFTARFYNLGALPPPPFEAQVGVAAGEYYRLLTSAFMQANLLHIALNMYALYLFGPPVEAALGRVRFAALYLIAAVGGSAVSYTFANPMQPSLGASGAIFGLLGAFLVINRRLGRDTGGVIALLLVNFAFGLLVPRIDWRAHLGGLAFGVLCAAVIAYAPARPAARRTAIQVAGLVVAAVLVVVIVVLRTARLQG